MIHYDERSVLKLVDLIYQAAGDPAQWTVFLEELMHLRKGLCATMHVQDLRTQEGSLALNARFDPEYVRLYDEYYSKVNPWIVKNADVLKQGMVVTGEGLYDENLLTATEFYSDCLRPQNIFYMFGAMILMEGTHGSMMSVLRPKSAGPFGKDEIILLETLMPHLQRAMELHFRFSRLNLEQKAVDETMDLLPFGVILLDQEGQVLVVNHAAATVSAREDGLSLRVQGLCAAKADENVALQCLIAGALETGLGKGMHPGGRMLISRPSLARSYSVLVTPVGSGYFAFCNKRAAVAILIGDPDQKTQTVEEAMERAYRLSPAERKLLALLLHGKNVEHAAAELGITTNTARTHMKRIFAKTGTHRRSELMRLALGLFHL